MTAKAVEEKKWDAVEATTVAEKPSAPRKEPFKVLMAIDVNDHIETKNGLNYLSWAWAWSIVKSNYPNSFYTIYENDQGWNYFTDGKTCWVKTGVTIVDGDWSLEHIEYLPVMDFKNKSIPQNAVTSYDVNKTIQRSLTKALARHGLGLYIYAGEDLPMESEEDKAARVAEEKAMAERLTEAIAQIDQEIKRITAQMNKDQKVDFAKSTIVPIIGQVNYKTCKDSARLDALLAKLSAM